MNPTVLCGVDGTWRSCRPLMLAAALARRSGHGLAVVHATSADGQEARRAQRERIAGFVFEVLRRRDVPVLLATGPTTEALVAAAGRASALVMGTRGRSGVQQALRSSACGEVVRRAPCPVLVVPPKAPATVGMRSIVCAVRDHRDLHVAATAACWARDLDAELVLTAAVRPPRLPAVAGVGVIPPPSTLTAREILATADFSLGELAAAIEPIAPCRTRTILGTTSRGHAIQEVLADEDATLAVLGAPKRGPLRAAMARDAPHVLLRRATCAVMVCPQPATALETGIGLRPDEHVILG